MTNEERKDRWNEEIVANKKQLPEKGKYTHSGIERKSTSEGEQQSQRARWNESKMMQWTIKWGERRRDREKGKGGVQWKRHWTYFSWVG